MIIDFHTHVFPDKIAGKTIEALKDASGNIPYTDGSVDGLLTSMEKSKVDISIALPVLTTPKQFESVNNFALSINERFKNEKRKIISFGGIHPDCENVYDKLKFLKDNGIKGIKIHPDYQKVFIDDERYINILKVAKELDLIVVTHAGIDDGFKGEPVKCPPERALKLIERVKHKKFVLAHYGGCKQWGQVIEKLCGLEVYFDTAFTLREIEESVFKTILYKHGADRILFATDCPWQNPQDNLKTLDYYNLNKETKEKILYKNAQKLLNI